MDKDFTNYLPFPGPIQKDRNPKVALAFHTVRSGTGDFLQVFLNVGVRARDPDGVVQDETSWTFAEAHDVRAPLIVVEILCIWSEFVDCASVDITYLPWQAVTVDPLIRHLFFTVVEDAVPGFVELHDLAFLRGNLYYGAYFAGAEVGDGLGADVVDGGVVDTED